MKETWKPILNYKGLYSVSSMGRVRRDKEEKSTSIGKIIKPYKDNCGYFTVGLYKNGTCKRFLVHKLVIISFIGRRPNNKQINHKDGDKSNNTINNLEYITAKENFAHSILIGIRKSRNGENNPLAKLKCEDIFKIRNIYNKKYIPYTKVALLFNVCANTIKRVVNKSTWNHIKD